MYCCTLRNLINVSNEKSFRVKLSLDFGSINVSSIFKKVVYQLFVLDLNQLDIIQSLQRKMILKIFTCIFILHQISVTTACMCRDPGLVHPLLGELHKTVSERVTKGFDKSDLDFYMKVIK